ncbi:hypothetical protein FBY06_10633 [Pseudomonas sp. SJZ085]|nr:hypothetical protein FBX99_106167 [Pseudomonas sp. SJZ074]TWC39282.1 hypothetical protein FBY06_10633 [Pseudomonas sp. SJZ085]
MINSYGPDIEDTLRRLAHLYHAMTVGLSRYKVQICHLADGVPNSIIISPLCNLPPMKMCNGNAHDQSSLRDRQCFETVSQDY